MNDISSRWEGDNYIREAKLVAAKMVFEKETAENIVDASGYIIKPTKLLMNYKDILNNGGTDEFIDFVSGTGDLILNGIN